MAMSPKNFISELHEKGRMMSDTPDRQCFEALQMALELFLSADAKKSFRALRAIMDLFPGQPLVDIEKSIRTTLASSQNSVPDLAERARAIVNGQSPETADNLAKVVGKLPAPELKQLAKALGLALAGTKSKMTEDFRIWVESGGRIAPQTPKEKAMQKAKEYAYGFAERMQTLDVQTADEINARAEEASRDKALGAHGFKEFARLHGVTVDGTKPKMLKQFKEAISRMAVSHGQTQF
jgi:hypothetical protein